MKVNWNKYFFYQDCHESAGALRAWVSALLIVGIILVGGYIEGLDQAANLGH